MGTLERLSLLENPVTKVKHYRPYMISKCSKTLRILDFNRIKDKERKAAGLLSLESVERNYWKKLRQLASLARSLLRRPKLRKWDHLLKSSSESRRQLPKLRLSRRSL